MKYIVYVIRYPYDQSFSEDEGIEAQVIEALHATPGQELSLRKTLLKWAACYKNLPELSQVPSHVRHTVLDHHEVSVARCTLQILCQCTSGKGGPGQGVLHPFQTFLLLPFTLLTI